MKDQIGRAFDDIRADDALLVSTAAFLRAERTKRENKRSYIRPLRFAGALAAMLVLVVGIIGYRGFYYSAAAYVSIDVNPSLELTLNPMDRVIEATAYNADGDAVLQKVNVNGKPYDEAAPMLLAEMEQQGYLSSDVLVTMTVQTADGGKEQVLCDVLLQSVNSNIHPDQATAEVEVFPVTRELRETAHGRHMSVAKYLAIQELMEVDDTATLEEYSDSTIRQIRQRTQTCREEHGSSGDSSGNPSHGNGQGSGLNQNGGQGHGNGQNQGGEHGNGRGQGNGHGHQGNK